MRDLSEFVSAEQALLALQTCAVIVAEPSFLALSAARCSALGLTWSDPATAPLIVVLDPAGERQAHTELYPAGPRLCVVSDGEQLVAVIGAAI
jgi:hypothetical protein